ncbi:MAG: UDP-glucose 4-epimerase GalE [Verrucomicrobiaceae bacterium]|nr:UDP-glucose 4-epimerase GalE [Verrucomicrobiaceae bacterium]
MKVLVTGGAGYIGSVAVDALLAAGHEVAVLDNLYMGHRAAVNPQAVFFEADLADKAAVDYAMGTFSPDSIMHFAAYSLVGESVESPFKYLGENVSNAIHLIDSAIAHGVERFILSSTANLFDEPETIPIAETERIVPGSPYGESKFFVERILHWAHRTKGLRYAALRYFNAAGCTPSKGEDHDPETHLIPLVIQVALGQRESIKIFGDDYPTPDGTCVRDYIHVEDLASAHILALEALREKEVLHFNLGNGNGFSVKEVVETVREVTGRVIPAEIAPRRAGDPATLIADSYRIREELGWSPRHPDLRSIVRTAWDWHVQHPRGYGERA